MHKIETSPNQDTPLTAEQSQRRDFMQKMVGLFGATTATAVLAGCSLPVAKQFAQQRPHPPKGDGLFSEYEKTILYSICETILPKTTTPGAVDVGCHEFVAHQLRHCHTQQQQQQCIDVMNLIDQLAYKNSSKAFPLLSAQTQQRLLSDFETSELTNATEKTQFSFLKALIVFGYFTSEVGASRVLNYQAVPGGFVGSIPADPDTKSWGSLDYY